MVIGRIAGVLLRDRLLSAAHAGARRLCVNGQARSGADHRDQQDQPGRLEIEDVVGVEDPADSAFRCSRS